MPTEDNRGADAAGELAGLKHQFAEAKRRLELTLDAAGAAGGWTWDIIGQRFSADARFAILTGQDPLALAEGGAPNQFFAGIHPDDVRRIRIAVAGILAGAEVFSKDYRLLREDGGIRWVHANGRTVLDEDDRPTLFTGTLVDVTDRKRTEEQLRVAQTAGQVGTFEHTDGFGTVTVSRQFCRLLGLHPTTVLPVHTINLLVHPADRPIIDPKLRTEPHSDRNIEFRITRADTGEVRWLARRGEYLQDIDASGLRYIGVLYDITEAKRIEQRLILANEQLSQSVKERTRERDQVWQNSRDLLAILRADGTILDVNPAWTVTLEHEAPALVGQQLTALVAEESQEPVRQLTGSGGERREAIEFGLHAADGSLHMFSWDATVEGELIYVYGHNITAERRQAEALRETEALLRQSQKMEAVGQLTGGIAHDFNNMLTGIIGALDVMKRRIGNQRYDDLDRFMSAAITSAQRAAALTHRLLAFSRRQSLDRKPTAVAPLIDAMRELLNRTLGEQIVLKTVLPGDIWEAVTDGNQLENAVLNLAINARDAMPEGGMLTIEAANASVSKADAAGTEGAMAGDYVVISVADTGEGMTPEVLEKAFDPFFTTKPIGQGTGLGLSMIYGFVRQSGGYVRLESTVGAGTTVSLYLPRNTEQSLAAGPDQSSALTPLGSGETVLIVEDDPAVRLLVVDVLRELGYVAIEAADSAEALPILHSDTKIDLMISDVGLPGLNGRQLAEIARQKRAQLRVLFITGYAAMAASRSEFLAPGMDMITKPFDIDKLATKIQTILATPNV